MASSTKIHACAEDPAIPQWGFDYLLEKLARNGRTPPHLAVTHGAQWSRDSQPTVKLVSSIQYVPERVTMRPFNHFAPEERKGD